MIKEKIRKMSVGGRRAVMMIMMAILVVHFFNDAKNNAYQNQMSKIHSEINSKSSVLNQLLTDVEGNASQLGLFVEYLSANQENAIPSSILIQQYLQTHTVFQDKNVIVVFRDSKTGIDQLSQFNDSNHDEKIEITTFRDFKKIGMGKTEYEQFERVFRYGKPLWSSVLSLEGNFESGKQIVIYSVPIITKKTIGFVGVVLPMETIINQMQTHLDGGYFAILDKSMSVVYHPSFKSNTDMTTAYNAQFKTLVKTIKESSGSGIIHYKWVDQRPKTLIHVYLLNGWNFSYAVFDDQMVRLNVENYLEIVILALVLLCIALVVEYHEKVMLRRFKKTFLGAIDILKRREQSGVVGEGDLELFVEIRKEFDAEIISLVELNDRVQHMNETLTKEHKESANLIDHLEMSLSIAAEKEVEQIELIKQLKYRNCAAMTVLERLLSISRKSQNNTMGSKDLSSTITILLDMILSGIGTINLKPEERLSLVDPIEAIRQALLDIENDMDEGQLLTISDHEWHQLLKELFTPLLEAEHIKCYWIFSENVQLNDDLLFISVINFIIIALKGHKENHEKGHLVIKMAEDQSGFHILMQEDGIMNENARNECLDHLGRLVANYENMSMSIDKLLEGQAIQLIKRA